MAQHTSHSSEQHDDNPVDKAAEETKAAAGAVAEETKQQASQVSEEAKQKASRVAGEAQTEAQRVAEEAKQRVSDVSDEAQQTASVVASEAQHEARRVVDQATTQASQLMDDAQRQASAFFSQYLEQWTTQASGFSNALRQTGQNLREQEQGNQFAGYAESIADQLEGFSNNIRSGNLNQLMQDAEDFARREPAMFVGGALAAGVAIARFLKSSSTPQYDRSVTGSRRYDRTWQSSTGQGARLLERSTTTGTTPLAGQGYYRSSTSSTPGGSLTQEGREGTGTYDMARDPRVRDRQERREMGEGGLSNRTETSGRRQQESPSGYSVSGHSTNQEER